MAGADRLSLLGIRHHGPGSARSVREALAALDPAVVLIEGPPDANEVIGFASRMTPPVALLVHGQDDPANAIFYPFGVYSPEWQAMQWALRRNRPVRFIDLPSAHRLALRAAPPPDADAQPEETKDTAPDGVARDPLAYLAAIAGYDDSETWWNVVIEQGVNAPSVFAAIESAMAELRAHIDTLPSAPADQALEDQREAHMRLAIAAALKEVEGPVAVVCGAWHVPALRRDPKPAEDQAVLKGLPRIKVVATWVPWSETRLAFAGGYGAGVASPGWYAHLWREFERDHALSPRDFAARWQARVAALLRAHGRPASTASVIDATRLAESLAALRDLAMPGLDEMREASLATLCLGEPAPWRLIEAELVIGRAIGEIPDDVPQMPLQADLSRLQRELKLKPEALDRELAVDLRSANGLGRSLLLHRLNLINVPWGQQLDARSSRGTFRENWKLRWEPELSVRLAEALVHGTTIEQAAGNAAVAAARTAPNIGAISDLVRGCLLAGLADAARTTIALLQSAAATTSDVAALARAIPPLALVLRYGSAREMPREELMLLVTSLAEAVCSGLVYACRNLQTEEATRLRAALGELDSTLPLLEHDRLQDDWRRALGRLACDGEAHPLTGGFAVRALHEQGTIAAADTAAHLSRALSRAVAPSEAGAWLDGFLGETGQMLLHDAPLLALVDEWLGGLDEEAFTALLPMLRRAFASIDHAERRSLFDAVRRPIGGAIAVAASQPDIAPEYIAALPLLLTILGIGNCDET